MTINELQILLDLNKNTEIAILKEHCYQTNDSDWLFVDSDDGKCHLFSKNGKMLGIKKLKYICCDMFNEDDNLKRIVIPDSVTDIRSSAFYKCGGLTNVTIPNSVTDIGFGAFEYCSSLTSVTIPDNVTSIRDYVFFGCSSLTNMTIPSGLSGIMSIGDLAFGYCNRLTNVTIGNGVTSIGDCAFYGCSNLKSLVFKGKTMDQVKEMTDYPWGIEDESVIKAES